MKRLPPRWEYEIYREDGPESGARNRKLIVAFELTAHRDRPSSGHMVWWLEEEVVRREGGILVQNDHAVVRDSKDSWHGSQYQFAVDSTLLDLYDAKAATALALGEATGAFADYWSGELLRRRIIPSKWATKWIPATQKAWQPDTEEDGNA